MSRPHDARAERSRAALKHALLELVESNQFDQIAIREITSAAGVSYPVFFRRYASKEELLKDLAEEEVRKLLSMSGRAEDENSSLEAMRKMCLYVNLHRTLWKTLLTTGAAAPMREEFMRIARDVPASWERRKLSIPHDLAVVYVTNGIFDILSWWLSQPEDYPVDDVAKLLNALVIQPTRPHNIFLP